VGLTPVGMNTAVYNASFVFVFVLSVIFLRESVTVGKVGGSVLCFGGLACVGVASLTSTGISDGTALGYLALFISMFCWACYSVVTVKLMGNEPGYARTPIMGLLSIGAIGCGTLMLCWVVLVFNHVVGIEPLAWPTGNTAKVVAITCACDFVLNCALMVGTLATSALFMSLGMLLVLPCGFLLQLILGEGEATAPLDIVAVVLIAAGCLVFNAWDVTFEWGQQRGFFSCCRARTATANVLQSTPLPDDELMSEGFAFCSCWERVVAVYPLFV
jgi:drug/metabolite transporter (DMT)-like permease